MKEYLTPTPASQYARSMDRGVAAVEINPHQLIDLGDVKPQMQQQKVINVDADPMQDPEFRRRAEQAEAAQLWKKYVEQKKEEGEEISQKTVDKMVSLAVPPKVWEKVYKTLADFIQINKPTNDKKLEDGQEKKEAQPAPTSIGEVIIQVFQEATEAKEGKGNEEKQQAKTEKAVNVVLGDTGEAAALWEDKIQKAVAEGKDADAIALDILVEHEAQKEELAKQEAVQRKTDDRMQRVAEGRERFSTLIRTHDAESDLQVVAGMLEREVGDLARNIPILEEDPELGERFVEVQRERIQGVLANASTSGELQEQLQTVVDDVYTTYLAQFPEDRQDETEGLVALQDTIDAQEAKEYISASEEAEHLVNEYKQEKDAEDQRLTAQADETLGAVADFLKEDRELLDTEVTSKGVLTRTRGEVLSNAGIDTKEGRQEKAVEILQALATVSDDERTKAFTALTPEQVEGIWEIHEIGTGGVYGYSQKDITAKARRAAELKFTKQQTRALMEAGIWGSLPDISPADSYEDPRVSAVARGIQNLGQEVRPEDVRAGLGRLHGLTDSNLVNPIEARQLETELSADLVQRLQQSRAIEESGTVRDRYVQELIRDGVISGENIYQMRNPTLRELIRRLDSQITEAQEKNLPEFARRNYQVLRQIAQRALSNQIPGVMLAQEERERLEELTQVDPNSLQTADAIEAATRELLATNWVGRIPEGFAEAPEHNRRQDPESFEDLIDLLMMQEVPKWREGEFALVKDGEVQVQNFEAWVRERMMYFKDLNPDSAIELFKDISIRTTYRDISFMDLMSKAQYFRKKVGEATYEKDERYENLKNHLLYEVWLFNTSHNNDVNYRLFMGIDAVQDGVLKQLKGIHFKNEFTADKNRILRMLRLPTITNKNEVMHALDVGTLTEQGAVGKAIQRTLVAFNYMSEASASAEQLNGVNMFEKALGGEVGVDAFYESIIKQLLEEKYKPFLNQMQIQHKNHNDLRIQEQSFDLWGDSTLSREYRAQFMEQVMEEDVKNFQNLSAFEKKALAHKLLVQFKGKAYDDINIFNKPKIMKPLVEYVQGGMVAVLKKVNGLEDSEAQYAAAWGKSMVYWLGVSAKNDTSAIGHDALTKVLRTTEYRRRQVDRFAKAGDLENLFVVKMPGIDFLNAAKGRIETIGHPQSGKTVSLLEWLQGGAGTHMNLDAAIADIDIEGNAQKLYGDDHLQNAFMLYEWLVRGHGFKFEQFIGPDPKEPWRIVVDQEKMDSAVRDVYRAIRYTFNNYEIDYNQIVRLWEKEEYFENGRLKLRTVFKEKKLGDFVFGEDGYKFFRLHEHEVGGHGGGHGDHGIDYMVASPNDPDRRGDPAKKVLLALFAAEFRKHRNWHNQDAYWDDHMFHMMEQALLAVPFHVSENQGEGGDSRLHAEQGFFNHHEIHLALQMSRATKWDFLKEAIIAEGGAALLISLWGLFEELFEGMKDAAGMKGGGGRGGHH